MRNAWRKIYYTVLLVWTLLIIFPMPEQKSHAAWTEPPWPTEENRAKVFLAVQQIQSSLWEKAQAVYVTNDPSAYVTNPTNITNRAAVWSYYANQKVQVSNLLVAVIWCDANQASAGKFDAWWLTNSAAVAPPRLRIVDNGGGTNSILLIAGAPTNFFDATPRAGISTAPQGTRYCRDILNQMVWIWKTDVTMTNLAGSQLTETRTGSREYSRESWVGSVDSSVDWSVGVGGTCLDCLSNTIGNIGQCTASRTDSLDVGPTIGGTISSNEFWQDANYNTTNAVAANTGAAICSYMKWSGDQSESQYQKTYTVDATHVDQYTEVSCNYHNNDTYNGSVTYNFFRSFSLISEPKLKRIVGGGWTESNLWTGIVATVDYYIQKDKAYASSTSVSIARSIPDLTATPLSPDTKIEYNWPQYLVGCSVHVGPAVPGGCRLDGFSYSGTKNCTNALTVSNNTNEADGIWFRADTDTKAVADDDAGGEYTPPSPSISAQGSVECSVSHTYSDSCTYDDSGSGSCEAWDNDQAYTGSSTRSERARAFAVFSGWCAGDDGVVVKWDAASGFDYVADSGWDDRLFLPDEWYVAPRYIDSIRRRETEMILN